MTSAQSMLVATCRASLRAAVAMFVLFVVGCGGPKLSEPRTLVSPYDAPKIWGVAPLINESGTSALDVLRLTDSVQRAVQEIEGIDAVPVNRVIAAMRELEINGIRTPHDARAVMSLLGLDALIVGSITAYDPYRPMIVGLAFDLFATDAPGRRDLDMRRLERSPGEMPAIGAVGGDAPAARAAGIFSASNHQVLKWLADYADGRNVPDSAYGADIYLVSMDLYTQFAGHRLLTDLLRHEHDRLTQTDLR